MGSIKTKEPISEVFFSELRTCNSRKQLFLCGRVTCNVGKLIFIS